MTGHRDRGAPLAVLAALLGSLPAQGSRPQSAPLPQRSQGLHGYIGFTASRPPNRAAFAAGMSFYSAVWSLIDRPLAHFQIGLASAWITPDNSDNQDRPLAPVGTLARTWKERGPTWASVFQTLEGGLGYWAGNHFRYGPPKFSMNATPQCYDYEVGSPGWSFFQSNEALPEARLGIAQLTNRLLIPPDGLTFEGQPDGDFLGYAYMALPFTPPTTDVPPTGDQAWTCFLQAANFRGAIAYYIPETWSKIGELFDDPFLHGRGLDARRADMGGGAMEINTVPRFEATAADGTIYMRIPELRFPVDAKGRTLLIQNVTYYSKEALYDRVLAWREGGRRCSGHFDMRGAWQATLSTRTTHFEQAKQALLGIDAAFDTKVFENEVWGLQWRDSVLASRGTFPAWSRSVGDHREAIAPTSVPATLRLQEQHFALARPGAPYTSPKSPAWTVPGPKAGPFEVRLGDGSTVTYSWYRFIDQPSFRQYAWSEEKKARLQAFIERIHGTWSIEHGCMPPPTVGRLVALDRGLLVTPPAGLEVGYVPIVTGQALR